MDGLSDLFYRLRTEGMSLIRRIKDEEWPETLYLEFKSAQNNSGPMAIDDRKNLGNALSGFANSDGGIVIWGIGECKDNSEDPAVAKELKPIDKLSGFLSDLQNYTSQLTSPPVTGVIHEPIRESEGADTGYIISYIPASEVNGQGLGDRRVVDDNDRQEQ